MTDENLLSRVTEESSRRSFLKKGTIATAGLALGSTGSAVAQDGGDAEQGMQAFMFPNQFVSGAQFTVDAQIDWTPQGGQQDVGQQVTTTDPGGDTGGDGGDTGGDGGDTGGDGGDGGDEGGDSALQDQAGQVQTYVIQYDFSQSQYAFLFVPGDGDGAGGDTGDVTTTPGDAGDGGDTGDVTTTPGDGGDGGDGGDEGGDSALQDQGTQIQVGQTYQLGQDVTAADQAPVQGVVGVTISQADGGQAGGDEGGDTGGDGGDGGDEGGDGGDTGGNGGDGGDTGGDGGDEGGG